MHADNIRCVAPMPRGTVIPRYWGDGSRFGGQAKPDWAFDAQRGRRQSAKRAAKARLLASL